MNDIAGKSMVLLYALLGLISFSNSALEGTSESNATMASDPPTAVQSIDNRQATLPKTHELKSYGVSTDSWASIYLVLKIFVVAALVSLIKKEYRVYLAVGFFVSLLLFLVPILGLSSIGFVALLVCFGFLIHLLTPKPLAEKSLFLGIALAIFAYAFAVAGGIASHQDEKPVDRYSTALYEATQLPLMNMSPHDAEKNPDAKLYFTIARILGCLFAYFVAYKTVYFVCQRARTQISLGCYCLKVDKPVALVFGLGAVGRRLIRNLLAENHRVVAIEADKDSVHIERAQALGAQVIVGDALDDRVYDQLPFDAAEAIYVVAGDDQRNLEIGQQLLTYSKKRVAQANHINNSDSHLRFPRTWIRWGHRLIRKAFKDADAVCHVQLYDSNMQRLLEQEHFCQPVETSRIEMRHFNAQQNAVRDLVQRELAKPGVRPDDATEVGLYFIVGFEELGQEVALGIAHLAHFDNLKRPRIVVFCSDPDTESAVFLATYPKFTTATPMNLDWQSLAFDPLLDDWNTHFDNSNSEGDAKYGVTFATNTLFTHKPISPSDESFLQLIYKLTKPDETTSVKPCIIVCDKDVSKSFKWSSEFASAWATYAKRKGLQPECKAGSVHPSLNTYFWLQGHKAIRDLVEDNVRHIPFGLEENCISTKLLDATLIRQLASVVQHSYDLAIASGPAGNLAPLSIKPVKFEFLKSNLHAAAHSLIKYQIAGGQLDAIFVKENTSLLENRNDDSFVMNGYTYSDPGTTFIKEQILTEAETLLLTLGKMEHNRWLVEKLLQGYEFIHEEVKKVDGVRLPQHEHQRETLCSWEQLSDEEKRKDLRQAFFVLYYLNALASR